VTSISRWIPSFVVLAALAGPAFGQSVAPQPPIDRPEPSELKQGWTLLDSGDVAGASRIATALLTHFPRSGDALELAVQTEIARGGAVSGLTLYERWLGSRLEEHRGALHRVAAATLHDLLRSARDRSAAVVAADALVADGDATAAAELQQLTGPDDPVGAGVASAAGNPQAVSRLLNELNNPLGNRRAAIAGLVKSKSPLAVRPLTELLSDPNPAVRAQVADALGELGLPQAAGPLKPLLDDPVFSVRFSAATALFALHDPAGRTWLRQVENSDVPAIRLQVARATRSEPDGAWQAAVQTLAKDPDPEIRRQAAALLAPHDPDAARAVIEPLLTDPNPAEREAANDTYLLYVATDLSALRRALRHTDPGVRARAGARLLQLTH